jgi:hypothetical protein
MIVEPVQVTPSGGGDLNDNERRSILDAAAGLRPALIFCVVVEAIWVLSALLPLGGPMMLGLIGAVLQLIASGMLAFALVRIADGAERAGVRMLAVTAAGLLVAQPLWTAIIQLTWRFNLFELNSAFISITVALATYAGYGLIGYILGRMSKTLGQPEWPPFVLGTLGCTGGLVLLLLVRFIAPSAIPHIIPTLLHAGVFVCALLAVNALGRR